MRSRFTGRLVALARLALRGVSCYCRPARLIYYPRGSFTKISKQLKPVGCILEMPGYSVWYNSPIYGP